MYHDSAIGAQYYGFPLRFACYAGDRNIDIIRLLLSRARREDPGRGESFCQIFDHPVWGITMTGKLRRHRK